MTTRGRPRKLTKKKFLLVYGKHKTIQATAQALGVTPPTVYNYIRRCKADLPSRSKQSKLRNDIVASFASPISVPRLAANHGCTPATARYHLRLFVARHWAKPQKYPKPQTLGELKLALILSEQPGLYDDPPRLAQKSHLSAYDVIVYLERIFHAQTTKANASRKA